MRKVLVLAALVAMSAGSALAADGSISSNRAARLGLAGMQPMSAEQGARIRGMGLAIVFGVGRAQSGGTSSTNAYLGASSRNNAAAVGANFSRANGSTAFGASAVFAR